MTTRRARSSTESTRQRVTRAAEICRLSSKSRARSGESGTSWAHLYFAYDGAKLFERAAHAAERAHTLAPHDLLCLSAWERFSLHSGDKQRALSAARTALEKHPYQHLGDERLGLLYARDLNAELALKHSLRAVRLAPFCHLAHASRALALFAANDVTAAQAHAHRSVAIETSAEPNEWGDAEALLRALRGDVDGLEQLFANRDTQCRAWPFPEYDAKLRALARERP